MLSIVVPCYNEEKNIPLILSKFEKIIFDCETEIEVILVNNGSTDNTEEVLSKELLKVSKKIRTYNVEENIGYGHGILSGLKIAKGNILSWTHADLQTEPRDVILALNEYNKHKDDQFVIKGKRKNRNLLDAFFTFGMQVYSSIALNTKLDDINAQPKLFSRAFYESILKNAPLDFSLDLYLLINAKRIKTVDVFFKKRKFGEAKGGGTVKGKIKLIKRTLSYINKLKKNEKLRS